MKRYIEYLFFLSYKFFKKMHGNFGRPLVSAWLFVSFLIYFLLISLINFSPLKFQAILEKGDDIFSLILGVFILCFFYFLFLYKNQYLYILEKFENSDKKKILTGKFVLSLTIAFIITFYIISLIHLSN
jgi:hypothetical protein